MSHPPRIAVVGDVHCGPDQGTKLGSRAPELLDAVLAEIERQQPDLVVELGDRINEVDPATDLLNVRRVAESFDTLSVPRVHLVGNHDVHHLSVEQNEAILGSPLRHHSREAGGWHLVFWNPDCRYTPREGNLRLGEDDLAWLDADLTAHQRPTVLFSHAPAHRSPMEGNLYFERRPEGRAWHLNVQDATDLLERHRHVILCVSGHTHWNALNFVGGIGFLTLPSLTESFTTPPHATGGWGLLTLSDPLAWSVRGRDPWSCTLPATCPRSSWLMRHPETRELMLRGGVEGTAEGS